MHPYENLGPKYFWAPAVAQRSLFDIAELWDPKFKITPKHKVVTYGSCFAQHIGRALRAKGFNWHIAERAPPALGEDNAARFNYGIFSARTGNIYTVSLLKQWVDWASGAALPPDEIWEKKGRCYDPFRPNIEPDGFASAAEVVASREMAIEAFRRSILDADVFVFTLGLTESWTNARHNYEYPMCPGTVAGDFDESIHKFTNQTYTSIMETLIATVRSMRGMNKNLRFLLTVSPVPLTATMSGRHVLVATMHSKSILRAIAGQASSNNAHIDYFPSYEIINAPPYKGAFFEPNMRSVNHTGVAHVMDMFFSCLQSKYPSPKQQAGGAGGRTSSGQERQQPLPAAPADTGKDSDVVCEEALLEAFRKN